MTGPAWHEDYLVAYDCETTGVDIHRDRIVTAAVVHLKPGQRPRALTWVIDPAVDIADDAATIHGWTKERIHAYRDARGRGAYTPDQAMFEIAGHVALPMSQGVPVVAFNAAFDLSVLEAECARHDIPTLTERLTPKGIRGIVDPFVIDKHYSRRKGSRKLADQVAHYQVMLAGAHDAAADALAAARLVPRMVAAYPELGRMSLAKLHQSQIAWRAGQQASLAAYFDKVGKDHDGCCGSWPVHGTCCSIRPEAVAS